MVAVVVTKKAVNWRFGLIFWTALLLLFITLFLVMNLQVVGSGGLFGPSTLTATTKVWLPPNYPVGGARVNGLEAVKRLAQWPAGPRAIVGEREAFEELLPYFSQAYFAVEQVEYQGETFVNYMGKLRAGDKVVFLHQEKVYQQSANFRLTGWELKHDGTLNLDFEKKMNFIWLTTLFMSVIPTLGIGVIGWAVVVTRRALKELKH